MLNHLAVLAVALLLLAGCQQDATSHIPTPNLQPPVLARSTSATPRPATGAGNVPPQAKAYIPPLAPTGIPRSWIPAVPPRNWNWIVVHHSDTPGGSAAIFDRYHRYQRKWENGLGYDFVIGNGTDSADGQIEVGARWTHQLVGAHAGVLEYNERGIGICLVGDFQSSRPTPAQMKSLAKLTAYLMKTYRIPPSRVIGHRDFRSTNCPGRYMDLAVVRSMASALVLAEDPAFPMYASVKPETELLYSR